MLGQLLASMVPIDYFRSGLLIIAFVATMCADKKGEVSCWIAADAITSATFGFGLLVFPKLILSYQVDGDVDVVIEYLTRTLGALLVASAVVPYFSMANAKRDHAPSFAWILSRLLGSLILVQLMVYAHVNYQNEEIHFNYKHATFAIFGCILWSLGHVVQLMRLRDYGVRAVQPVITDRLVLHILVDVLVAFMGAMFLLTFTHDVINTVEVPGLKPAGIHEHMERMVAGAGLMHLLYGLSAIWFERPEDKKAYMLARIAVYVQVFIIGVVYQSFTPLVSLKAMLPNWVVMALLSLNLLCGVLTGRQTVPDSNNSKVQ